MGKYRSILRKIVENNTFLNSYIFYGDPIICFEMAIFFSDLINGGYGTHVIDKEKLPIYDIREIVNSAKFNFQNKQKIFIIKNFDSICGNISDILLKPLEDGCKNTIFILVSKNINMVSDTIRSRCQKFHFKCKNNDLSNYLLSYVSQDFFKCFFGIPELIKEKEIIFLLDGLASHLYSDGIDDYRIYNLIKKSIIDIKNGLEKQLIVENLMIELKNLD